MKALKFIVGLWLVPVAASQTVTVWDAIPTGTVCQTPVSSCTVTKRPVGSLCFCGKVAGTTRG